MESALEYNQFFGVYRGALLQLITLMAEMEVRESTHASKQCREPEVCDRVFMFVSVLSCCTLQPLLCFQVVLMRYQHLFSQAPPTDHISTGGSGFVTMRTSRFLELEGTGSLLECLFRSVSAASWADTKLGPQLQATCEQLLRLLLQWTTEDPLLQTRRLHVLGMFTPVLEKSAALFQATLDALLTGVSFRPASLATVEWSALPEDLKACRRRAIVSLIQLARRREQLVEPFFLPRFPQLLQTILGLLHAKRIADAEKIALFEFLVLISQAQTNPQEQQQFLNSILAEPIATWTSPQMNALLAYGSEVPAAAAATATAAAATPSPFLQLIGLNPEDQHALSAGTSLPPSHRTATRDKRREIGQILHTFMSVFKPMCIAPNTVVAAGATAAAATQSNDAARSAATQLLPVILPNVLRLLGHIYSIRSPRIRAALPAHMHGLLSPTADQLLNPESSVLATVAQVTPAHYHLLWDVRRWMDKILDSAVNILMLAAKSGENYYAALATPAVQQQYIECLYANLSVMHVREMRALIDKYIEVVFNLCPPRLYMAVLMGQQAPDKQTNTLPTILNVVHQRLEQGWAQIQAAKQVDAGAGRNSSLVAPAAASSSSSSLSSEIHEESELRELSRCISENFSRTIELQYVALHNAHTAANAVATAAASVAAVTAAKNGTAAANSREEREKEKERRQQESRLLMQVPFCQLIFTQQPLLSSLFPLLLFLMGCPDSASSVRALRVFHRLLPVCIGSQNPLALQLYGRVFESGVRVLASANQQTLDVVEMELVAMLKDIYVALVLPSLSLEPRTLLLSLPGATEASVAALEKVLGTTQAEKKYRTAMRNFLDRHIKQTRVAQQSGAIAAATASTVRTINPLDLVATKAPTSQSVRDLAPLNLPARAAKPGGEDVSGIGNLFQ